MGAALCRLLDRPIRPRCRMSARHWARVPRAVVLHRIATAECLDDRLLWAIILWSWCGPQISKAVVLKDDKGFIRLDQDGNPIPATLSDIRQLLRLPSGMRAHVTRSIQHL